MVSNINDTNNNTSSSDPRASCSQPKTSNEYLAGLGDQFQNSQLANNTGTAPKTPHKPPYSQTLHVSNGSQPDLNKTSSDTNGTGSQKEPSKTAPASIDTTPIEPTSSLRIRLWLQSFDDRFAYHRSRGGPRSQ